MNQWEFAFESSPIEEILNTLDPGSKFSATRFLTLMEQEPEESLADALQMLQDRKILLDITDLPAYQVSGEMAVRLKREAQLVKSGLLPVGLEENDPLRLYLEELAGIPACGDVQLLAEKCLAGDENAMRQVLDLLLSRVVQAAYALAGKGVLLLDLIQEGSLALWQAIHSYSGGDMEEHCTGYIERSLAITVAVQARENGVGQKMRQAMEDYRAVDQRLLTELGRNPTLEEMAEGLHMTVEEASTVAETMMSAQLLQRVRSENQPKEPTPDDNQAVEDTAYFQMRQRVQELLSDLDETSAKLLTLRFGLEGGMPLTPAQAGKLLNMTPEEAVAAEAAALAKLRKS